VSEPLLVEFELADVKWRLGKADEACEVWVRRLVEEPGRPQVVHIGRGSGKAKLDLRLLPTGSVSLDLAAHDGFHVSTVSPADARWLLDGNEVATGLDVWIVAPAPGEHRIALVADDQFGRVEQTAVFRTVETESPPSGAGE
jgi:hypothetical protein